MSIGVRFDMPVAPFVAAYRRAAIQRIESLALTASNRAAVTAKRQMRAAMSAVGLARLGQAIGATSDLDKGRGVYRRGQGFSASGILFLRSRSERTIGTLEAYTEGADITPKTGGWLWIAQPDIPTRAGKYRMTPARYNATGLDVRIGPLRFVRGISRNVAYLVVDDTSVDAFGRPGRALRKTKTGKVRKGRVEKKFLVAFVGIRRTARTARVDPRAILRAAQRDMGTYIETRLGGSA